MTKYNDLLARLESEFEKGERRQAVKLLNDFFKKDKKESFERTVCLKQIIRLASEWIDKFETEEVYHIRAGAFFLLKEYESAIANYERAIAINPRYENPFFGKGTTYLELKDYQNALECFTSAIKINPMYFSAYLGRAWVYFVTEDYLAAVQDYTKAIELQPNHETTYYNRGLSYEKLDNFESALEDYRKLLELNLTEDQYLLELTEAKVVELEKKIEDPQYRIINDLVNKIKSILQFDESCVSHYTSLSATKSLILDKSLFRLSEGTYLNDTSEGRELFNYLNLPIKEINLKSSIPEVFFERPFIGSFVSETKHDDLALWRMYGKEAQAEAKGCVITIKRDDFLKHLKEKTDLSKGEVILPVQNEVNFIFYKVAYKTNNDGLTFVIPGADEDAQRVLNEYIKELKVQIEKLNKDNYVKYHKVAELLNQIAFLFKSSEFQYEHEVRLVVSGVGFEKVILKDVIPPRVYIELISIIPIVNKITLGPKVDRADEWAAAFNYMIKKEGYDCVIVISHLPFK